MQWVKVLGLAGVVSVAATGVVIARDERRREAYSPEEIRARLHERYQSADVAPGEPTAEPAEGDGTGRARVHRRILSAGARRVGDLTEHLRSLLPDERPALNLQRPAVNLSRPSLGLPRPSLNLPRPTAAGRGLATAPRRLKSQIRSRRQPSGDVPRSWSVRRRRVGPE